MSFNAGAIVGRMALDTTQWKLGVNTVKIDQNRMKQSFSELASSFKQNWFAMTTVMTAAALVARQAWISIEGGTRSQQIEDGFMGIARGAGIAGEQLKKSLESASAYTAEFSNIASSVSALIRNNISQGQIVQLMQVARAEARKTGEDVQSAFNQISSAVTSGFTRSMRTAYGINIDATVAIENYARQTGLTKNQVEQFYKSQAIANEILKKTKSDLNALGTGALTNYEKVQQLNTAIRNFLDGLGIIIYTVFSTVANAVKIVVANLISDIENAIAWGAKLMSMIPGLKKTFSEAYDYWSSQAKINKDIVNRSIDDIGATFSTMFKQTREESDAAYSGMQGDLEETNHVFKQTLSEWLNETRENFNAMLQLGQGVFQGLSQSFSDLFYDTFTGQLNSLNAYFASFGQSILRTMADIAAEWAALQIFMGVKSAFQSLSGWTSPSWAAGGQVRTTPLAFADGTDYVPSTGIYKLHGGERVIPAYDAQKSQSGGGDITIINQITPGFVNAAIASEPGTVINVINENSIRNGSTRRTYKRG